MEEITILGAGTAGLALIEKIREGNPQCKISLIDKNPYYFNKADYTKHLSLKKWVQFQDWLEGKNINFIDGYVEKINLKRRKIYFKEREVFNFETLIIAAGLKSKKNPLKGDFREGLFYLSQIDPFKLRSLLKISSEVTVYVSTILGIQFALGLSVLDKEVKILGNNFDFLFQEKERVINFLREINIPVYLNVSIEEIIGEGTIKAVKINPLKVFSSQIVIIDSGFLPNRDFFDEGVKIKDNFFTDEKNIYFLGDVNREDIENDFFYYFNHEEAKEEADLFARYLLDGSPIIFNRRILTAEEKQKIISDILEKSRDIKAKI